MTTNVRGAEFVAIFIIYLNRSVIRGNTMIDKDSASLLVVDDEQEVAEAYGLRLRTAGYDVETAYGGEQALETVDDTFDILLLDRRMPMAGDEVLKRLRDRSLDIRVIMVTAVVNPDFDIIDMDFDDYLCKPVEKEDLLAAVEQQLNALSYDDQVDEYFQISSKIGVLEAEKSSEELAESEEYQRLQERAAELQETLETHQEGFNDMVSAFDSIQRGSG